MQGGVIGLISDIWQTIKNEIKGPKVKEIEIKSIENNCINYEFENNINIKVLSDKKSIKIEDFNKNVKNINVINGMFDRKIIKISMLKDRFKINTGTICIPECPNKQKKIVFNKISTKIFSTEIPKSKSYVNLLNLNEISKKCEKILIHTKDAEIKECKIINKKSTILSIPKIVKGKKGTELKRDDVIKIIEKLKKKVNNIQNYYIESYFQRLPVKNIRNIKYFIDRNEIEIYLKDAPYGGEEGGFIILRNKIDNSVEKFII